MLRLRVSVPRTNSVLKAVKELDAFPKVPETYVETSASGGGVSLVTFLLIAFLIVSEVRYYSEPIMRYDYSVDTDHSSNLKINLDITVASPCTAIGTDVLDSTGQMVPAHGNLEEIPTTFELPHLERMQRLGRQQVNSYLREHYHRLHELLWQQSSTWNLIAGGNSGPATSGLGNRPPDACRFRGTLEVNKVAGNLHIIAGKPIHFMGGQHAHIGMLMDDTNYNFSHRIDKLSFGDHAEGIINPLDGDEMITPESSHLFQYFVKVVPTIVDTRFSSVETYQYAVTERNRTIDHHHGSHGMPGIFIKYDMAPLKVHVREAHRPLWRFFTNLAGIVGGVFATSGILNSLVGSLVDVVCCRFKLGSYSTGSASRHHGEVQAAVSLDSNAADVLPPLLTEHMSPLLGQSEHEPAAGIASDFDMPTDGEKPVI